MKGAGLASQSLVASDSVQVVVFCFLWRIEWFIILENRKKGGGREEEAQQPQIEVILNLGHLGTVQNSPQFLFDEFEIIQQIVFQLSEIRQK